MALFLANRGLDEDADVDGRPARARRPARSARAEVLTVPEGGDRHTTNAQDAQDRVGLRPLDGVQADGRRRDACGCPPLSWAVVELEVTPA